MRSTDPSARGGRVITKFVGDSGANAVIVQPDGKIVAAGSANVSPGKFGFALARYNPDGSLDPSFGKRGKVTTGFFLGEGAGIAALVLQPDGKIVAGGRIAPGTAFALARYKPDGSLDASFGRTGKVTTDFFGGENNLAALVLQPDGKIVAGGSVTPPSGGVLRFALARYNGDGTLDASFGTGGEVTTELGRGSSGISAVALIPSGKIVAGGWWRGNFALARYNQDGRLDTSFGTRGIVATDFFGRGDSISDLALQRDGEIVVGGGATPPNSPDAGVFALARYQPDGKLDPDFGVKGKVTTDFLGRDESVWAVALQPDGRLVAVGAVTRPNGRPSGLFALARYTFDGHLDPGFGVGGEVWTGFRGESGANAVDLQPNGKIVAAGSTASRRGGEFPLWSYFVVARYQAG